LTPTHGTLVFEKTLGFLDGDEAETRIELVQVSAPGTQATLELRMQRNGGELGWVTQRRIRVAPGQMAALRMAVQLMDADALAARPMVADNIVAFPGCLAG
jgi:hypothetical protein